MTSINITREDLDREMNTIREIAQIRADAVSAQLAAINDKLVSIDSKFEFLTERIIRMEMDAKWFRRVASSVFAVCNILLGCYLKGVFR